jgi:hypothetical protein
MASRYIFRAMKISPRNSGVSGGVAGVFSEGTFAEALRSEDESGVCCDAAAMPETRQTARKHAAGRQTVEETM